MKLLNRLLGRKLSLALVFEPGMMAVVQTWGTMGKLVRFFVRWIKDPGVYSHALIITRTDGQTLEANWHFDYGQLSDYIGCKILIVRDLGMTPEAFQKGMDAVMPDIGAIYPVWRLPLFLLGIEKYFDFGIGVCDEEVAKFWVGTGLDPEMMDKLLMLASFAYKGTQIYGLTPDDLVLAFRKEIVEGKMIVVYDGVL